MNIDPVVSHRIALLRTVMIFGVVLLHTPLFVPVSEVGPSVFDSMKAFFQNGFFRGAVPVLTFISGLLLFASGLDEDYLALWKKKARVILLPFLVFNLGLLAAMWAAGMALPKDLVNAALGLTGLPINYPLNFLRDMIALFLITPLLSGMLRGNANLCLPGVILFFLLDLDGQFILRNDMPIIFYLGGMAAVNRWDMSKLDDCAGPLLALFCTLSAAVVMLEIRNTNFLRYCAPLMLWPAARLIAGTRIGLWLDEMSKYSFFVFLAHAPILALSWKVYLPYQHAVPYPLYWIAAPVLTIALLIAIHKAAMRWMPGLFSLMIGCKPPKKATVLAVKIAHQ